MLSGHFLHRESAIPTVEFFQPSRFRMFSDFRKFGFWKKLNSSQT